MAYTNIVYEEQDSIGLLTLNRPAKRNALSLDLLEEVTACLKQAAQEESARAIIVRGAGPVFSAGHDIGELVSSDFEGIRHIFRTCADLMTLIHTIPQPVIAQVHGVATAAGCQLVAACDLAVAEEGARFSTPGVKIGLFCSTPGVPLSRTVGRKKALEMLLTGGFISAQEALACGLLNRVVPEERLAEEAWSLAKEIAGFSPAVVSLGKGAFYQQIEMAEGQAYRYATEVIATNALLPDAKEGMSAFLEKRAPVWKEG